MYHCPLDNTRGGLLCTFVTRINLFENDVTRVSLFYFYTAVRTIDNVSLNVIRMFACTDINMSLTCFQKGWKLLRRIKIYLSLYTFVTKDYGRRIIHSVTL